MDARECGCEDAIFSRTNPSNGFPLLLCARHAEMHDNGEIFNVRRRMTNNGTAYISGPMRGIPKFNFPEFDSITKHLRAYGSTVVNPAERDREVYPDIETWPGFLKGSVEDCPAFDLDAAMAWDLARVEECDRIIMLPGWQASYGAVTERRHAEEHGKTVYLAVPHPANGWALQRDEYRMHRETMRERLEAGSAMLRRAEKMLGKNPELPIDDGSSKTPPSPKIGDYETKDSGERVDFPSGMRRDTDEGKPRYDLIPLMPLQRLAELYARGAVKYGDCNWQLADSPEELARFKASCFRHLVQWLKGEEDEDHAIAVVWNVFAALWLEEKLNGGHF